MPFKLVVIHTASFTGYQKRRYNYRRVCAHQCPFGLHLQANFGTIAQIQLVLLEALVLGANHFLVVDNCIAIIATAH